MPYPGSVSSIARLGNAHEGGHPPGAAGRRQAVHALLRGQDRKRSTGGGDFPGASLVLVSGRILTMDAGDTVAEALAVQGEHIAAVGTDQQVLELASSGTEVVDLRGRTVVPGFIDAHAHVELGTFAEHFWLDLRDIPLELAKDRIAERVSAQPPGTWILGQGTLGQELPSRDELDTLAPRHAVALRLSMHRLIANTQALNLSGIRRGFPASPTGSWIHRDALAEPTGVISEGFDLLAWESPSVFQLAEPLRETLIDQFLSQGVTTVYEIPASAAAVRAYQHLKGAGRLPVRLRLFPTAAPGHQPLAAVETFAHLGIESGFGDDWLAFGGSKIFVDGWSEGAWSSEVALRAPASQGFLTRTLQRLIEETTLAFSSGVQVWLHAGGDVAQRMAVTAIEEAHTAVPDTDHRARIEHIFNQGIDESLLERVLEAGALAVPNPTFMFFESEERRSDVCPRYPIRSLQAKGLRPPGSSDSAGSQPWAINPWFGIKCMVARENCHSAPIDLDEAIGVADALRAYTIDAAYAGFEEGRKGSLEVGKLADLVVLAEDPFTIPASNLDEVGTDLVIIGGAVASGATR